MDLVKCPSGHFYDASTHSECPYCGVQSLDLEIESTMAHTQASTQPESNEAKPKPKPAPSMDFDTGKTMGVFQSEEAAAEPCVGWLVCIEGEHKGKDYRLHTEKNFVGREPSNDVSITGDNKVSRKNHAIISFNPKKNTFKILPGDGRGLVYLNDEEVYNVQDLNGYDVIELGDTKLMFVPFCGPKFIWEV